MSTFFLRSYTTIFLTVLLFVFSSCSSSTGSLLPDDNGGPNTQLQPEDVENLKINEINAGEFRGGQFWIEIYNSGGKPINLGEFKLRSLSGQVVGTSVFFVPTNYSLPNKIIQPSEYIVIQGRERDNQVNGHNIVYIHLGDLADRIVPDASASGSGYCELYHPGFQKTSDYVKFGNLVGNHSIWAIPLFGTWNGANAPSLPPPGSINNYSTSIARDGASSDNNNASDWTLRSYSTPGGPNDITSTIDNDNDGIPDSSEAPGKTFAGLPLYDWGARQNQKDIFVHIDYMNPSLNDNIRPRKEALDKLKGLFINRSSQGIPMAIHFDVGNLFSGVVNPNQYNLDNRNHEVAFSQSISFHVFTQDQVHANFYKYKADHMPAAKRQIFHYCLIANEGFHQGAQFGGLGETPGNDFAVTSITVPAPESFIINYQTSLILHELGHNLELEHGGNEERNYKPNYLSSMNYLYSSGKALPTIGNNEGDRYYLEYDSTGAVHNIQSLGDLIKGPLSPFQDTIYDYSDGSSISLNEANLNESLGLGRPGSSGVDYNLNGTIDVNNINHNVNAAYDSTINTLNDHDDWNNLKLFFARSLRGYLSTPLVNTSFSWQNRVGDDRQSSCGCFPTR